MSYFAQYFVLVIRMFGKNRNEMYLSFYYLLQQHDQKGPVVVPKYVRMRILAMIYLYDDMHRINCGQNLL